MNAPLQSTRNPIDPVKLEKLAEVAIKVGLQLQKGQDLVMTAPIAALPLVRLITKHAYMAGAGLVTTFYADEEATLARYAHAPDESFDRASDWLYEGMAKAYAGGAARLAIAGDNPMLLSAQDPAKVARANKANSIAYKPALEKISNFDINWNIVSYPNPSWAKQMFPDDPEAVAVESWQMPSSPPRASTSAIRSPPGKSTMPICTAVRPGWTRSASPRCISPAPAPTSPSGWRTATNGMAAPRSPRTASPAIRTSRRKRSSLRRMRCASKAMCRARSRSPIRAR